MHLQRLLKPFGDCCVVYKISQQMVFVFPIDRSPRLTSIIGEKKNLESHLGIPFYLGGAGGIHIRTSEPSQTKHNSVVMKVFK